MSQTFVAMYHDFETARQVVEALVDAGFNRDVISLVANDSTTQYGNRIGGADADVEAPEGAGFGAVIGTLLGLGSALIPGVGPIIAGGTLGVAALSAGLGAAAGALTGGLAASMIDLGIPEEDIQAYLEGLRRGGAIIYITVHDSKVDRAVKIMDHYHPLNLEQQKEYYQQTGWNGYSPDARSFSSEEIQQERNRLSQGRKPVEAMPQELMMPTLMGSSMGGFTTYDPLFRQHFTQHYGGSGYSYHDYEPVYHYAYDLRNSDRYRASRWDQVELDVRRSWEARHPNTWEQFKDAIRSAWDSITH